MKGGRITKMKIGYMAILFVIITVFTQVDTKEFVPTQISLG